MTQMRYRKRSSRRPRKSSTKSTICSRNEGCNSARSIMRETIIGNVAENSIFMKINNCGVLQNPMESHPSLSRALDIRVVQTMID